MVHSTSRRYHCTTCSSRQICMKLVTIVFILHTPTNCPNVHVTPEYITMHYSLQSLSTLPSFSLSIYLHNEYIFLIYSNFFLFRHPFKPQHQHEEGILLGVDQLKETLKALIDDDRFIGMLHAQYRHRVSFCFLPHCIICHVLTHLRNPFAELLTP